MNKLDKQVLLWELFDILDDYQSGKLSQPVTARRIVDTTMRCWSIPEPKE